MDWDGVSPLVNFQKAGAPLDFLNYVQRRGKNDDNTFMDVPVGECSSLNLAGTLCNVPIPHPQAFPVWPYSLTRAGDT